MRKLLLTASAVLMAVSAAPAFAAVMVTAGGGEGSTTDPFNTSAVTVTSSSPILDGFDVADAFGSVSSSTVYGESGGNSGVGHVIFNGQGTNTINFTTGMNIALKGISIIVSSDGGSLARSFDTVTLFGRSATAGSYTNLGTASFVNVIGPQTATFTFGGTRLYSDFIFSSTSSNQGPRLIEIDAITAVPELSTWAMMFGGFAMMGGALRRRKTTVAFAA